jgi:hypothetical protein
MLAEDLARGKAVGDAWNFGPTPDDILTVGDVADLFVAAWAAGPNGQQRPV